MPLAFTDDQLAVVQRFASVLHPSDRSAYLQRVAALLRGVELGDGSIHAACAQAQLEYRRPTASINGRASVGKWAR